MSGSTIGGNSPRRARQHVVHERGAVIDEMSFTEIREMLREINETIPVGMDTEGAQALAKRHIKALRDEGLI